MSLKPEPIPPVPEETARVARAAFPRGNVLIQMRDALGTIYTDELFADLFPTHGQPAEAPWRLALVTVFQFMENLTDRQAADAVRRCLDWKYALSLELTDPGFDHTVLSEFRARLVEHSAEERLLDAMLELFKSRGWLKARGKQRTDSTHVLAKVRALNRLECVGETLFHVLNVLAEVAPAWLQTQVLPDWKERYGHRYDGYRLPVSSEERQHYANVIGADGWYLLATLEAEETPAWLRELPAVETLRRIWAQQYYPREEGGQWQESERLMPAKEVQNSPYDPDARYAQKRSTTWVGYKVHLTEICDPDVPHIITQVATTVATVSDDAMTESIHRGLDQRMLLPGKHLVDTGYVDAALLVSSPRDFGVELIGPTRANYKWQAKQQTGFAAENFTIDWERQEATCPEGHTSSSWTPAIDRGKNPVIKLKFSTTDCQQCPSFQLCTTSVRHRRRTLTVRPYEQYLALQAARQRQKTEDFKMAYARRAGVEGSMAQGVRSCGMRRSRYLGQPRTHLQHIGIAAALNVVRLTAWLAGIPVAKTRVPPFVALMTPAA